MSEENSVEDDLVTPDEMASLKEKADRLGVTYHPSIGLDKLRVKVRAAMDGEPVAAEELAKEEVPEETLGQRRFRKRKEASELIRVRVSCMNPAKKEWEGELFTAGNMLVGTFTKFVPFNTDAEDGWHVPRVIYNQLVQRKCQIFVAAKDVRGNKIRQGKQIKEFAVEVLPPLTAKELSELARRQAMSQAVD
jgi:hypothetical protein